MNIEEFIRDLPWSDQATDAEKTLVEGNLRNLYARMVDEVKPMRQLLADIEAAVDNQIPFEPRDDCDPPDDEEIDLAVKRGLLRRVTRELNMRDWLGPVE